MDLIIIVINKSRIRKRVNNYLKDIGLGDYMTIYSKGTEALANEVTNFRIDTPFDNKEDVVNSGKTIFIINNSELSTKNIIDEIHNISETSSRDTGITFSIPINKLYDFNYINTK